MIVALLYTAIIHSLILLFHFPIITIFIWLLLWYWYLYPNLSRLWNKFLYRLHHHKLGNSYVLGGFFSKVSAFNRVFYTLFKSCSLSFDYMELGIDFDWRMVEWSCLYWWVVVVGMGAGYYLYLGECDKSSGVEYCWRNNFDRFYEC